MANDYLKVSPLNTISAGDAAPVGFDMLHPEYVKRSKNWKTCRDAEAGQYAIKDATTAYLPKLSGQDETEYQNYLKRALYYNATGRTVQSYEGMIFRKDPIISVSNTSGKVSVAIDKSSYYNRVTNTGKSLSSLLQDIVHETIITNRVGLLVDYPAPEDVGNVLVMTKADKEKTGYKPLLTMYQAESIINWHTAYIGSQPIPVLYVLKEEVYINNGGLYPSKADAYRILMLEPYFESGTVEGVENEKEKYRYKEISTFPVSVVLNGSKTIQQQVTSINYPRMNGEFLNFIPFYILTDKGVEFQKMETPIIYDLAELNISHYRNSADWENELHIVASKTIYFPGWDTAVYGQPRFGGALAGPATCIPSVIEASNKSGLADEMKAKEERMSVLGSEAISKQGRYVASAATAKISSKAEASILTTMSVSLSAAFSEILTFALAWDEKPNLKVEVVINTDFYDEQISGEELIKWMRVWQSGGMSFEAYYNMLESREVYPEGWDQEKELESIRKGLSSLVDLPEERYMEVMSRISDLVKYTKLNESGGIAGIIANGIPEDLGEEALIIKLEGVPENNNSQPETTPVTVEEEDTSNDDGEV